MFTIQNIFLVEEKWREKSFILQKISKLAQEIIKNHALSHHKWMMYILLSQSRRKIITKETKVSPVYYHSELEKS